MMLSIMKHLSSSVLLVNKIRHWYVPASPNFLNNLFQLLKCKKQHYLYFLLNTTDTSTCLLLRVAKVSDYEQCFCFHTFILAVSGFICFRLSHYNEVTWLKMSPAACTNQRRYWMMKLVIKKTTQKSKNVRIKCKSAAKFKVDTKV